MNTQQDHEFDAGLRERLEKLQEVPARDPEAAARGRANYLASVRRLSVESAARNNKFAAQAVPLPPLQRFNGWLNSLFRIPGRQQRLSLAASLATLVLTLALFLGSAGVTVYAAQSSLPYDFLYPVKILSEDMLLDLTSDPQARFDLLLDFTDRRVNEIVALAEKGKTIPNDVIIRLETQDDAAFLILNSMDASKKPDSLLKAKIHKQNQDRDLGQIRTKASSNIEKVVSEIRARLQWQYGQLEEGGDEQQNLQELIDGSLNTDAEPVVSPDLSPDLDEEKSGPGECQNCTPVYGGSGPGPGPSNQGEVTQPTESYSPGSGPGPGNQDEITQPTGSYGPGPGPGPGQMAPPTESPGNESGEVEPLEPPAETPVPGGGGPGPSGDVSPPAPDSGGGGNNNGGGSGKP